MAISRPIVLALVGAILALGAFYATSGGRQAATDSSEPAAEAPATPVKPTPERERKGAEAERRSGGPAKQQARPGATRRHVPRGAAAPPEDVRKALARKRTVVLFFYQRRAADDDATARSVSSLRRRSGVRVFSAPVSKLGDYQAVIGGAGVSQAPAIVILGRDRAARLIEGYVDAESLAQLVADAR